MDKDFEQLYHSVEKDHWWFRARRETIISLLSKLPKQSRILDIGCSSGILLGEIKELGFDIENLYGIDISEKAIQNCKANGIQHSFLMDAEHINLNNKFDVIISSDCLEHLQDDEKALHNWFDILNEGGIAIIFVPAFSLLWSHHDVVNKHRKRYTRSELVKLLKNNNFKIVKSGYWNFFLFFPTLLWRLFDTLFSKFKQEEVKNKSGNIFFPPQFINKLLILILRFETRIIQRIRFPLGVSVFAIGSKQYENK